MTNLIFAIYNFANAHRNEATFRHIQLPKPRRGGTVVHIKHEYRARGFFLLGFWGFGLCSLLGSAKKELRFWMKYSFRILHSSQVAVINLPTARLMN